MQTIQYEYPIIAESFVLPYQFLIYANIGTAVIQTVALILISLTKWYEFKRSRRLAVWAWILFFFSPFLITFIPYRSLVEIPGEVDPQTREAYIDVLGLTFGLYYFLNLAPGTLTLSLALFRTALNLRSLLPQNPLMGYLCVIIPIVTTPLIWLSFVPLMQSIGDYILLSALIVFSFSPLTFLIFQDYLTTPMKIEEAYKYATRIRMGYLAFLAVSVIGFFAFVVVDGFSQYFANYFTDTTFFEFCFSFLSEYFFGYVFAMDLYMSVVLGITKRKAEGEIFEDELERENIERTNQLFQILDT